MREDTGKVSEEALVDCQDALGTNSLEQAIKDALVQVTTLVIHASHDGIWSNKVSTSGNDSLLGRIIVIPGGCMKQHTTKPEAALLAKCRAGPSSIPKCRVSRRFAKKYVGS